MSFSEPLTATILVFYEQFSRLSITYALDVTLECCRKQNVENKMSKTKYRNKISKTKYRNKNIETKISKQKNLNK